MTKIWKAAGVWLVITATVWLFSIWRWQTMDGAVSDRDIALQLGLLPVMLTVAMLAVLWGAGRLRSEPARTPPPATAPAVTPGHALGGGDEALRHAEVHLLASAASLRTGADTRASWAASQGGATAPDLDPLLLDLDGMPIFSGRVAAADDTHDLTPEGEADGLRHADGRTVPDAVRRAWRLMEPVLAQLLDAVVQHTPVGQTHAESRHAAAIPDGMDMKAHLSGVAAPVTTLQRQSHEAQRPRLTVRLALPATWLPEDQSLFVQALRAQCGPLLDWAEATNARGIQWHTVPPESIESLWDEVDQAMIRWHRDPTPELMLLLAASSAIDETEVERLQMRGELFTSRHQQGCVPGEAAVGLLLASPAWPGGFPELDMRPVRLGRPLCARRDKSADAIGRVGTTTLVNLLTAARERLPGVPAESLRVVSDADHRGSRAAELFEALTDAAAGIDPATAVVRLGASCGDLGVARAMAPVALAHAALAESEPPAAALAVLLQDSHARVVMPLRIDTANTDDAADRPPADLLAAA